MYLTLNSQVHSDSSYMATSSYMTVRYVPDCLHRTHTMDVHLKTLHVLEAKKKNPLVPTCRSLIGFQSCSINTPVSADVRFRPRAPTAHHKQLRPRTRVTSKGSNMGHANGQDGLLLEPQSVAGKGGLTQKGMDTVRTMRQANLDKGPDKQGTSNRSASRSCKQALPQNAPSKPCPNNIASKQYS